MSAARAEYLFDVGNAHNANGAWDEATSAFAECTTLAPDNAAVLINFGNALVKSGRTEEAVVIYRRCLAIVPGHVNLLFDLGGALVSLGRLTEAVEAYVACVRRAPDFGAAYVNLAGALRNLGVIDHARTMAETALHLLPDHIEALICRAGLHYDVGAFDAAASLYGDALAVEPGHAGVLTSLANALHSAGRLDAALPIHDLAYAAAPDNADYRYNRALSLLASGDHARGWAEHEWRLRRARTRDAMAARGPAWDGGPIAGQTILLHAEQGFGDTLQFVRYAPLVAATGAHVVLEVPETLIRLMRSVPGVARILSVGETCRSFDTHCAMMSLPHRFATTQATVPARIPYLAAEPADIARWRAWLPADDKRLVGLVWAGGAHHGDIESHLTDRRRSLPVTALDELAGIDQFRFVSLQKDAPALPARLDIIDPMPLVIDFADTAAVIANLDLVIAVDTAVAHLAGALGKPVWLLSRYDGCWRWGDRQTETPWYPTMRIFRQSRPGDWDGVVAEVAKALVTRPYHKL